MGKDEDNSEHIGMQSMDGKQSKADDKDIEYERKLQIEKYVNEMKKVFDPRYVNLDDDNSGNYSFVDERIFRDMLAANLIEDSKYNQWASKNEQAKQIDMFLMCMSLCHTVQVEADINKVTADDNDESEHVVIDEEKQEGKLGSSIGKRWPFNSRTHSRNTSQNPSLISMGKKTHNRNKTVSSGVLNLLSGQ
ncbi:hypothetical protein AX774_g584, partial [Zancudomyces culisetae]